MERSVKYRIAVSVRKKRPVIIEPSHPCKNLKMIITANRPSTTLDINTNLDIIIPSMSNFSIVSTVQMEHVIERKAIAKLAITWGDRQKFVQDATLKDLLDTEQPLLEKQEPVLLNECNWTELRYTWAKLEEVDEPDDTDFMKSMWELQSLVCYINKLRMRGGSQPATVL